jgi:alanine dehydrogenase
LRGPAEVNAKAVDLFVDVPLITALGFKNSQLNTQGCELFDRAEVWSPNKIKEVKEPLRTIFGNTLLHESSNRRDKL